MHILELHDKVELTRNNYGQPPNSGCDECTETVTVPNKVKK